MTDDVKSTITFRTKKSSSVAKNKRFVLLTAVFEHTGRFRFGNSFRYPLLSVPLLVRHVDGSMKKTDQSKVVHRLESFFVQDLCRQM